MIRNVPIQPQEAAQDDESSETEDEFGPVTVGHAIISQPHERTPLVHKHVNELDKPSSLTPSWDLESLLVVPQRSLSALSSFTSHALDRVAGVARTASHPKTWDRRKIWQNIVSQPASYLPAIGLGLLLNILDALSYGKIYYSGK